ncbi:DUF2889 domain-containing protein [Pseudomonas akapageensis]|uniref:DUF2889 domain-containing protein n=1 Tax=Pseudomonas akapageensis TaxID=2609961 RepID=UPI001409C7F3|nr:DUF2889 domain-containing protein [Pseudomonas akapageensis]
MTIPTHPRTTRKLMHTRQVTCCGYERSDGLYEIEGRLHDSKAYDSVMLFKDLPAGEPVHQMRLTLVFDLDMVIHELEACTEVGPTPYCAEVNPVYAKLVGLKIGPGFKKRVFERVGGSLGCTHLTELLGPMATTAFQTTFFVEREPREPGQDSESNRPQPKPWIIGTCHAYRPDGKLVRMAWYRARRSTMRCLP